MISRVYSSEFTVHKLRMRGIPLSETGRLLYGICEVYTDYENNTYTYTWWEVLQDYHDIKKLPYPPYIKKSIWRRICEKFGRK